MKRDLTIGTRKSALALWQAEYIKKPSKVTIRN